MKIFKPREVAKILNVSVQTLQNWDNSQSLIAYRYKGTERRFYTEKQIEDFVGFKIIDNEISNDILEKC